MEDSKVELLVFCFMMGMVLLLGGIVFHFKEPENKLWILGVAAFVIFECTAGIIYYKIKKQEIRQRKTKKNLRTSKS